MKKILQLCPNSMMTNFAVVPFADFELGFKISSMAFWNSNSNLKWHIFNIAVPYQRDPIFRLLTVSLMKRDDASEMRQKFFPLDDKSHKNFLSPTKMLQQSKLECSSLASLFSLV
jgi:hypothetical protein